MGLAWKPQFTKLTSEADRHHLRYHTVTQTGDDQRREIVAIPLRRYPMWLNTINPAKIPDLVEQRFRASGMAHLSVFHVLAGTAFSFFNGLRVTGRGWCRVG